MSDNTKSPTAEKTEINFTFREKLNSVIEGFRHDYCYQCGACVADCPANEYSEEFNPRLILLKTLLGMEEELLRPDSEIWDCTNCYTCSERCPQDVRPIDIIIALKNLCLREGKAPDTLNKIRGSVMTTGITTKISSLVEKRRKEFNLPPVKEYPIDELNKILEID